MSTVQALLESFALRRTYEPSDCERALIDWFDLAIALPGKTPIRLAILIRDRSMIAGFRDNLILSPRYLREASISSTALHTGLNALEEAGLITAVRSPGRAPRVSIVEVQPRPLPSSD